MRARHRCIKRLLAFCMHMHKDMQPTQLKRLTWPTQPTRLMRPTPPMQPTQHMLLKWRMDIRIKRCPGNITCTMRELQSCMGCTR